MFVFTAFVGFYVDAEVQRFAVFAVKWLNATFRNADCDVFLAVFPCDFFGSLQLEYIEADIDGVIWHKS